MEIFGLALILAGIFAIAVGILILIFSKSSKVEGGGLFLIGPFPVIFGTSMKMVYIVLLIAMIVMLLYFFLILFSWR